MMPTDPTPEREAARCICGAAYPKAPEWQPIETAPKDGTRVLLWVPPMIAGNVELSGYATAGRWDSLGWHSGITTLACQPTLWMPLPRPPEIVP